MTHAAALCISVLLARAWQFKTFVPCKCGLECYTSRVHPPNMANLLELPAFKDPEEKVKARLILLTSMGITIASLIFVVLSLTAMPNLFNRALALGTLIVPGTMIAVWLVRTHRLWAAGGLLLTVIWLTVSLGAISAGGVSAPITIGYMFAITISGLLVTRRISAFITAICVTVGFLIAWAEMNGWLPPAHVFSPFERIIIYSVFFILALALQNITAANVQRLLRQTRESEAKYKSFLESIPTITYINTHGTESTTEYVSPQVANLIGYTQEEFLKDPELWKTIIHPDDQDRVLAENASAVESQRSVQMEYRLIAKDEKVVWVRDEAILVRDAQGLPQYWLGVWTDITTRKHSEVEQTELIGIMTKRTIQLQTAAEISRAVSSMLDVDQLLSNVVELIRNHFDYYYVGIFLLDESKTVAVLSAATGQMGRQMILNGHRLQVGDSSMIGWCIAHRQARIALDVGDDAVRFKNPYLPLTRSEMALPLIAHDTIIGAMTIQSAIAASFSRIDITALQTMADQIANAIDNARLFAERSALIQELETRNTELERFTYTVSHDLRSPLVTIRGFLGFLRQDVTSGDLARFDKDISRIANAVDKMQTLLNDLLELSRIGRIITTPKEVPFREVVDESVNLLSGILEEYKVTLHIHENLPTVYGDPTRLIEIMQNLISNAAKFMGHQPNPVIEIGTRGTDSDGKPVLFVRDNGMGIEPEYHERIFGLFNRLNPEIEGTGIGLTLVKRIVEVHGGRIWLESQPGQGTTFLFTLPIPESK